MTIRDLDPGTLFRIEFNGTISSSAYIKTNEYECEEDESSAFLCKCVSINTGTVYTFPDFYKVIVIKVEM